eukprot:TRINITY_DN1779_c0_g1_i1.p1 TRINITY_DN1779_c0_g1~~TRINITY_DN1779_c0_g1_i1.p1  ORF type:complete len:311 (-),score=50.86 TRINITY_DN1779_c0_g1_i1:98-1030(-)
MEQEHLGGYRVGRVLAAGHFGKIHTCTHLMTGQEFALKVVDAISTPALEVFKEFLCLKGLRHPNILQVGEIFSNESYTCFTMPKYSGGDVIDAKTRWVKQHGDISCTDMVYIGFQMVAAIRFIHSQNIVHRDIKPDNFFVDRMDMHDARCHVVLGDFGVAASVQQCERLSTQVGTPVFWAPEIFSESYSEKVDIWALGVSLYGLLSGRFPFRHKRDIKVEHPTLSDKWDPRFRHFLETALQKDEEERASADDLAVHSWLSSNQDLFAMISCRQTLQNHEAMFAVLPRQLEWNSCGSIFRLQCVGDKIRCQ